jgi:hypothetical protein
VRSARSHWPRIVGGLVLVASALYAIAGVWSALLANSAAYPALVLLALFGGAILAVTGLRSTTPAVTGLVGTLLRLLALIGGIGLALTVVVLRPFVAEPAALEALASGDGVTVTDNRSVSIFDPSGQPVSTFVLYPGARVDPRAYAAPARTIAEAGHRVVVLKCPFDVALLCSQLPDPTLSRQGPWVVGGHSLGGVAAGQAVENPDVDASGLVFWASYPSEDLSFRDDLAVGSIFGGRDGLTTVRDVTSRRDRLPEDTAYTLVEGAVHSQFGDYGPQPGDGEPTVSRDQAQREIVDATLGVLDRVTAD